MTDKKPLSEMSPEELRQALFFAEAEARMYDQSIRRVVPLYDLAHRLMMDLLADHLAHADNAGAILDIGAGTGAEALVILKKFPLARVVAVDLSEPILEIFRRKLRRRSGYIGRCELICGDIVSERCSADNLRRLLPPDEVGFKAVISAFTIHHLEHDEKQEVFQRVFEVLEGGGLFLNLDLFGFQSPDLALRALQFDLSWIERNFHLGNSAGNSPQAELQRLGEEWKYHYRNYNRTEPIESSPDAAFLPGQEAMLRAVGFREVSVPFRYWQCGVLWARK